MSEAKRSVDDGIAIRVSHAAKRYPWGFVPALGEALWGNEWRGSPEESTSTEETRPWALRDVDFAIRRGEAVAILGRNGAGKSTLLKVLAGVSPLSAGLIEVQGWIFPMIDLYAGLNRDLTGRENIGVLAAIMGLTPRQLQQRMGHIQEFSELGPWLDEPVRKYSSGMMARLGFSVAVNVDADILLIDEVLSVGDFEFQKKCVARISDLHAQGKTIVFVSHDSYVIERICDRAILLNGGRVAADGAPGEVLREYFRQVLTEQAAQSESTQLADESYREGLGDARITRVDTISPRLGSTSEIGVGEPVSFRLSYQASARLRKVRFGIRLINAQNTVVLSVTSGIEMDVIEPGHGVVECRLDSLPVMPNLYTLQTQIDSETILEDRVEHPGRLRVTADAEHLRASAGIGVAFAGSNWVRVHGDGDAESAPAQSPPAE